MSEIMNIARAVTTALADVNAELIVLPELTLRRNAAQRVIVTPCGTAENPVSRARSAERPVIRVHLVRHCFEDGISAAADAVCALAARFPGVSFGGAVCVSAEYDPILNGSFLREENLFLAYITLKFTKIN